MKFVEFWYKFWASEGIEEMLRPRALKEDMISSRYANVWHMREKRL